MTGEPRETRAALRQEAAHWLNLRRSGDMTEADRERFGEWLEQRPGAAEAYGRLERQWRLLGTVAHEPEIMAAREHDSRAFDRPSQVRRFLAVAAAILLVVTSTVMVSETGLFDGLRSSGRSEQAFRTGADRRMTTTLTDGSIITLDTDSEVRVLEMAARRRVELVHGHAFFQVAKDRIHPFLVEAADKVVHAVGTAFDVRVENDAVTVTLVEGKVRVDGAPKLLGTVQSAELVPGGRLVAAGGKGWTLTHVDTARTTSWMSGQLIFFHDPLATAITEINRYSQRKIVFVGGDIPDTRIVGVFQTGDVDGFVTAVELNGIAHVVSRSDDTIELARD